MLLLNVSGLDGSHFMLEKNIYICENVRETCKKVCSVLINSIDMHIDVLLHKIYQKALGLKKYTYTYTRKT